MSKFLLIFIPKKIILFLLGMIVFRFILPVTNAGEIKQVDKMVLSDIITCEKLIEKGNLLKEKGFKPGFDKMTADAAILWVEINGERLMADLLAGRYEPMPAMGFFTAKLNGSYRQLSRSTAIDRMIQGCVLEHLSTYCESFFHPDSFAYRPERGVGAALQLYAAECMEYAWVARTDPVACFDHMDHDLLECELKSRIPMDHATFLLLRKYIRQKVLVDGEIVTRNEGVLQGAPLSTLFCNLYFHSLDEKLDGQGISFIRYADDVVVFGRNETEVRQYAEAVREYMTADLKLQINQAKLYLGPSLDLQFLGHRFSRDRYGVIALKANDSAEGAFYSWHEHSLRKSHKTVDILSDGILRQKDYAAVFESLEGKTNLPLSSIEMINIYSSVIFDSGFLQKALDQQVYINLFDRHGALVGHFIPNTELRSPRVTHEQLQQYYQETKRLYLAKQFLLASFHNTRLVVRYYQKQNPSAAYELTLAALDDLYRKIKACSNYDNLLLLEAHGRKEYYDCFDLILKDDRFVFEKRSRRPPLNEVNAMLSFGNTVLYNMIANTMNRSPLDIRVGFLHATSSSRKESLNLDLAEVFKPLIVDRTVFSLVNLHAIVPKHFRHELDGSVYLTEEGKKVFLRKIYDKLDDSLQVKGRSVTYRMIIEEQVRLLVRHFRNNEKYKAYRQVR